MGYVTLHTICNPTQAAQAKLVFQTNRKLMTLLQSGTKINYERFRETNVKQICTMWLNYLPSEDMGFETKFNLAVMSRKISFWKWITCIFSIQNLKKEIPIRKWIAKFWGWFANFWVRQMKFSANAGFRISWNLTKFQLI